MRGAKQKDILSILARKINDKQKKINKIKDMADLADASYAMLHYVYENIKILYLNLGSGKKQIILCLEIK